MGWTPPTASMCQSGGVEHHLREASVSVTTPSPGSYPHVRDRRSEGLRCPIRERSARSTDGRAIFVLCVFRLNANPTQTSPAAISASLLG
jgi:hypothetical protein